MRQWHWASQPFKGTPKAYFRFNPGKEQKTMPDYNPYTIKRCRYCDMAKGKLKLAFVPDNELCAACKILQKCAGDREKSARAIERIHYLHEMEPLLSKESGKEHKWQGLEYRLYQRGQQALVLRHIRTDTHRFQGGLEEPGFTP